MSPKWLAPCSITANSVSGSILKSVSGTPTSLLKLPEVAMVLPFSERISVVSSFTVVLPQEPVRETILALDCWRTSCPHRPKSRRVSSHMTTGTLSLIPRSRLTPTAAAPFFTALSIKSCASKRSPLRAINKAPSHLRESVATLVTVASLPISLAPAAAASSDSLKSITFNSTKFCGYFSV